MTIGSKQLLWVWYDIELMKTHMDHAEKINMRKEIERDFEIPMHATKQNQIDKTSIEY